MQLSKSQAGTSLGKMIRTHYTQRGWSRKQTSANARVAEADLKKIEDGDIDGVSRGVIEKIIEVFLVGQQRKDAYHLLLSAKPPAVGPRMPKLDPRGHVRA